MKNKLRPSTAALLGGLIALSAISAVHAAGTVSAMGRVLPASGVIDVFGPPGDRVEEVLVQEGQWVEPGAQLARLESAGLAAQRLANAEARLAALKKTSAADVAVARQKLVNAETEARYFADRYQRIYDSRKSEFVSPDTVDERKLTRDKAAAELGAARSALDKVSSDAEAALADAAIAVAEARRVLAKAEQRSPLKAQVLKIRASPGQGTDRGELFKLGDTSSILIVAEVYESDALKVKAGQRAMIDSPALPGKIPGVVAAVSSVVMRNQIDGIDPNQQSGARVVEVRIKVSQSEPLDRLILLQVGVVIAL
jgi:HlyD family secretion protein